MHNAMRPTCAKTHMFHSTELARALAARQAAKRNPANILTEGERRQIEDVSTSYLLSVLDCPPTAPTRKFAVHFRE